MKVYKISQRNIGEFFMENVFISLKYMNICGGLYKKKIERNIDELGIKNVILCLSYMTICKQLWKREFSLFWSKKSQTIM